MHSRFSNTRLTWLAGILTTLLFLGTFVPLTLQRATEGISYRADLAHQIVARSLTDHLLLAADPAGAGRALTRTPAVAGDAIEVYTRSATPGAAELADLRAALNTRAADGGSQGHLFRVPESERVFLSVPSGTRNRVIEVDLPALTAALDSGLEGFWLELTVALRNGAEVITVENIGHTHSVLWSTSNSVRQSTLPVLGAVSTTLHEHHPIIPIETLLVLVLATTGMVATWFATRIVRRLDVLQAATRTKLTATQAQLSIAEEISGAAQKLDAVGKLTGGVAHDFNNLLTVVLGNAEVLRERVADGDPEALRAVDDIVAASRRGAELTRNMLAFARRARLEPTVLDLNKLVRDAQSWMTRTLPESIDVEVSLLAGLWPVLADRAAFEAALLNLLLNASDAMKGAGKLTIETANVRIDDAYNAERGEDLRPGRYVMLAVSDNGSGIRAEDMPFVFDPFFTTKPVGQGTGLGLSMVQGFIKQTGGTIRAYSELGQGTTFKLYFPASAREAAQDTAPAEGPDSDPRTARLLLVEDEEAVRAVLVKTLSGAGFSVVAAASGDEALAIHEADSAFDLIITDIVMPGTLQGPALAKAIRAKRPDARFIFISGYANEAQVHGNGLRPEDVRLMKPIPRETLVQSVRQILGEMDRDPDA